MYLGYELFSRFADGSVLDTTVNSSFYSRPELKFYCKSHPGLDIAELFAKHQWGIERFQTKRHTEPVALGTTLVEVARELDNAIARRDAVAQLIRIIATPPGEPPESIRAAWIGCVLPLFATTDDPRVGQQGKGALTQQPEKRPDGFAVQVVEAMAALERHNPAAAVWWRENAPDIIQPGKLFVYGADVCEVVEEI